LSKNVRNPQAAGGGIFLTHTVEFGGKAQWVSTITSCSTTTA